MKKFRVLNLITLIIFLLSISVGVHARQEDRPDFSLMEYLSGKKHSFEDIISTKVNAMVITSTTCGSCISELKAMDWIRAKFRGDMSVTAVFIDRGGESRVYRYLDYYKFDLDRLLVDPGETIPSKFNSQTIPTLIMFDKRGNERYRQKGFKAGDESLIIAHAEEILYGKELDGVRAGETSLESEAPDGYGKKTTGCASTG